MVLSYYFEWLYFTDRSNSDGGFNGQTGIQRYTTSKYTNAIHAGLCTLTPTYDRSSMGKLHGYPLGVGNFN